MRLRMAALALAAAVVAVPVTSSAAKSECFLSGDWRGWRATPDSKAIYIRVGVSRVYRLDLSTQCPSLQQAGVHLVTRLRGGPWICHPLDLDLSISDGHGFKTPCIVNKITRPSSEEATALPKDQRP